MKSILVSVALAFSFQSFASTSAVLCKTSSGKIQNLLSGEWDSCADALYTGDVCFVGKRSEVIDIINSDEVRNKYDGTDGEYVKGAHYNGADIAYFAVDEANSWSEKVIVKKCTPDFFNK